MSNRASIHHRLDNEFPYFARHILSIRDKAGDNIPFVLNIAQEYLHKRLEEQKRDLGRVRALVLKGRQQGCSTYIGGRYYHQAVRKKGKGVFILSHEAETTEKLFKMVERYYDNSPPPARPKRDIANRRRYEFKEIGSEYAVGTAGNESVGRGGTVQLFHGSEVAFWEKTDGIETGILQSVADIDGTEIVLESTANGMGNMFYRKCMDALDGKGDYQLIFIPWYWQPEYRREVPSDGVLTLSEEEVEYKTAYKLDNAQIYWRRGKAVELGSDWKFKQEYPAHVMEAFQTSGDTLIHPESIIKARKSDIADPSAPLIMGVDPGRNRDRTVFVARQGRQFFQPEVFNFENSENVQMLIAGKLAQRISQKDPQKVFIDVGFGYGVIDRLKELGFGDVVEGVHFGEKAMDSDIFLNKRAEMWCTMRDWFHGEEGEVSMPDSDVIQKDLMSMPGEKITSASKTQLVAKEQIRKLYGISPDIGDAMALTFAYPVRKADTQYGARQRIRKKEGSHGPLKTLQRSRGRSKITTEQKPFWSDY